MSKRPYKSNTRTEQDIKINKAIGKKIREARAKRVKVIFVPDSNDLPRHTFKKKIPCTQTELSKALGVTFQQIQKYERGHNGLSTIKLLKICNFFNKPLDYFLSDAIPNFPMLNKLYPGKIELGQNTPPSENFPSKMEGLN